MTRGARLVLLLLSSWLLALPALRLAQPPRQVAAVASRFREARVAAGEHFVSQVATLEVPRAPLLARLPVPHGIAVAGSPKITWPPLAETGDLRDAVRRVQVRRRLPRLGGDDPPWS